MPAKKKIKARSKKKSNFTSKIKHFYSHNKNARLITLLMFLLGVIAVGLILHVISQKNAISDAGKKLESVKQQVEPALLAKDMKVKYGCRHEPKSEFETGPTYCAAILSGVITGSSDEVASNKFSMITPLLFENEIFGDVKFKDGNHKSFVTDKNLQCAIGDIIKINDTIDSNRYRFEITCKLHAVFAYYDLE